MIMLKRVYDTADEADGCRILVDRLWPRGVSKDKAKIDEWLKDIAPSDQLRKWYAHDVEKWPEFKQRYFAELSVKEALLRRLTAKASAVPLTFVFAAADAEHNNAVALKEYIERQ